MKKVYYLIISLNQFGSNRTSYLLLDINNKDKYLALMNYLFKIC